MLCSKVVWPANEWCERKCLTCVPAHAAVPSRAGVLDGESSSACAGSEDCGSGAESNASVDDITAELGEGLLLSSRFPVRLRPMQPAPSAGALPHSRRG